MSHNEEYARPPIMALYHQEHLQDIRRHAPVWIKLAKDKREFTASVSCHMGYVQPIFNALEMLWSDAEAKNSVQYLISECRHAMEIIQSHGFLVIPELKHVAEVCRDTGEPYMRFHYRMRRDNSLLRDVCKEFYERSKLLLTGSRQVPEELYEITNQFSSEVMVLRACTRDAEDFHAALSRVIPDL